LCRPVRGPGGTRPLIVRGDFTPLDELGRSPFSSRDAVDAVEVLVAADDRLFVLAGKRNDPDVVFRDRRPRSRSSLLTAA
jgi:hypothetical protein